MLGLLGLAGSLAGGAYADVTSALKQANRPMQSVRFIKNGDYVYLFVENCKRAIAVSDTHVDALAQCGCTSNALLFLNSCKTNLFSVVWYG